MEQMDNNYNQQELVNCKHGLTVDTRTEKERMDTDNTDKQPAGGKMFETFGGENAEIDQLSNVFI